MRQSWYRQYVPAETHYCSACWRNDTHRPLRVNALLATLAIVLTLGLALWAWPYRCITCGRTRLRRGWRGLPMRPD